MKRALPLILVVLAVLLLVWGVTSRRSAPLEGLDVDGNASDADRRPTDRSRAGDAPPSADAAPSPEPGQSVDAMGDSADAADAASDATPNPRPTLINVYDAEEERAAREAVSRKVFGADGPKPCTNVCDCAAGEGCQQPGGFCVPGLIDTPCCAWIDCPEGQACAMPDGSFGVCPEGDDEEPRDR